MKIPRSNYRVLRFDVVTLLNVVPVRTEYLQVSAWRLLIVEMLTKFPPPLSSHTMTISSWLSFIRKCLFHNVNFVLRHLNASFSTRPVLKVVRLPIWWAIRVIRDILVFSHLIPELIRLLFKQSCYEFEVRSVYEKLTDDIEIEHPKNTMVVAPNQYNSRPRRAHYARATLQVHQRAHIVLGLPGTLMLSVKQPRAGDTLLCQEYRHLKRLLPSMLSLINICCTIITLNS